MPFCDVKGALLEPKRAPFVLQFEIILQA